MATAKESQTPQQFPSRISSYPDLMAMPRLDKNLSLPYFLSYECTTAKAAFPGPYVSDLPSLNAGQQDAVGGFRPPHCNISYTTEDPYGKGSQCTLPCGPGLVDNQPVVAPQRRFLIFDQSENHTRLFFGPSFSPLDWMFASNTPASADDSFEKVDTDAHVNQRILVKPVFEEQWGENHPSDEEGEMDEDTNEINALVYSDSDDDEVTSTGHSPPLSLVKLTEVVNSDQKSSKRRRLLEGKYEKSSFESSWKLPPHSYKEDDAGDNDGSKKVKIREALKMLGSIIPGLDKSDPLSVIDGAVAYLKAMKSEAVPLQRRRMAAAPPPRPPEGKGLRV